MIKRGSPPMTPERAALAKLLVGKLGMLQHEAAAVLGVNQGRRLFWEASHHPSEAY